MFQTALRKFSPGNFPRVNSTLVNSHRVNSHLIKFPPDEFPPGEFPPSDFPSRKFQPRKFLPGKKMDGKTNSQEGSAFTMTFYFCKWNILNIFGRAQKFRKKFGLDFLSQRA